MKKQFGQNLSQIGALYDFYGQKNLGRQSSGIELKLGPYFKDTVCLWLAIVATGFFIATGFILVVGNTLLQDTKV